jgi:hypothetical protein
MIAGALSAVALMLCGRADGSTAAGPLNGPAQWVWGRRAARSRRWTGRTAVGVGIHQISSVGWASLHVSTLARTPEKHSAAGLVARAAATAALAATVDYALTPRRLQPGFDQQLSLGSMVIVYAAFAAGLALCDAAVARERRVNPPRPRPSR